MYRWLQHNINIMFYMNPFHEDSLGNFSFSLNSKNTLAPNNHIYINKHYFETIKYLFLKVKSYDLYCNNIDKIFIFVKIILILD